MKPDQHKISKNIAYKKKHGIPNDKLQNSNGLTSKSESRIESPLKKSVSARSVQSFTKGQIHGAPDNESNTVSEDEIKKSSFSRRKIESNWQKYEIDIDAGEETLRGADFSELLQATRQIQPQFQFGKYHTVDEELVTSGSTADWLEMYVSLDCDNLAAAFRCVPLHERLDIDESFFEESSLEAFRQDAACHMTAYQKSVVIKDNNKSSNQKDVNTEDQHHTPSSAVKIVFSDLAVNNECVKSDFVSDEVIKLVDGRAAADESVNANTSELGCVQDKDDDCPVQSRNGNGTVTSKMAESIAVNVIEALDVLDRSATTIDVNTNFTADARLTNAMTSCAAATGSCGVNQKSIAELEDELDSLLAM